MLYSITSLEGVLVRHMACSVTASLRANATFAFLGTVRSAIAWAHVRRRDPLRFRQKIAFVASNKHFRVNISPRFDIRPFRLISLDSYRLGVNPR